MFIRKVYFTFYNGLCNNIFKRKLSNCGHFIAFFLTILFS